MGRDKRQKASRDGSAFLLLPHVVLKSAAYRGTSVYGRALLTDIAMQFTGNNNGRLLCSTAFMKPLGWKSQDTLHKAKGELLAAGLNFETVKGQRPNKAAWYALTWLGLDRLPGFDPGAAESFVRSAYQAKEPVAVVSADLKPKPTRAELFARWKTPEKNAELSPPHGLQNPPIGPPHGLEGGLASPPHGPIEAQNAPVSSPCGGNHLDKPSAERESAPRQPEEQT